ncbi:Cof-type HAD-IIB family hydrolase [Luxibacter massiliensis]|uniref:Cof-type HAD-IIB family hydrolase n=1 Tax=Luxibacter massiliensis TaxID=2219695 RepID=UPI000F05984C|nr:Cof-type HAD-IIB family hydrolase [Luxibacter massiliensis]
MIKVIASDMDGTLLNNHHAIDPETLRAIHKACDAGIRFMLATGRNFRGALVELKDMDLVCDYIVGSGAEVRNPEGELVLTNPININLCEQVYEILIKYPVPVVFCTNHFDYRIGDAEEIEESFIHQLKGFHTEQDMDDEQIRQDPVYIRIKENTKIIPDFSEIKKSGLPIYKIFLYSDNIPLLNNIRQELSSNKQIAVAASFETNLEITDIKAQKGPVLKKYIESLGYTMDEVMVLGDSMNDFSMLEMPFGATVAMENAMPEVKKVAKYITKSNEELGVAHAINRLLEQYGL